MENYQFSYEEIEKHLGNKKIFKHMFNPNFEILPFVTSTRDRYQFDKGINGIIGEYFRCLLGEEYQETVLEMLEEAVESNLFSQLDRKQKDEFIFVMKKSLYDEADQLKILDATFFKYLDFTAETKNKRDHEKKIAEFMSQVFGVDDQTLNTLMTQTKYSLVQKIFNSKENKIMRKKEVTVINLLPKLTKLFEEDFIFLTKNQDKFTKSIELLLMHYLHTYSVQVCLQIDTLTRKNQTLTPIYYGYETEDNLRKSRKCFESGYRRVMREKEDLYAKVQLLSHLNYTNDHHFFGLKQEIIESNPSIEVISNWKKWIKYYIQQNGLIVHQDEEEILAGYDINKLIQLHFTLIKREYSKQNKQGTENRYGLTIEELAKQYFLKRRGPLGYVYNITPDFLNVLMAVCVKEDKIHIGTLFVEFEKRGIFTDKETQRKIIEVLDELDLLIKKSDGGEAQYVKSIL